MGTLNNVSSRYVFSYVMCSLISTAHVLFMGRHKCTEPEYHFGDRQTTSTCTNFLGKENYLTFDWWKHFLKILRRSEVTINLTRRLKKMGASEFAPL